MDQHELTNLVEQTLIDGATRTIVEQSIAAYCEDSKTENPTKEHIDAAYARCVERWLTETEYDNETIYAWHVRIRKNLMQMANAADDYKAAHIIAKDLADLQQQYKREKVSKEKTKTRNAALKAIKGGKK